MLRYLVAALAAGTLVSACGGGGDDNTLPVAAGGSLSTTEDTSVQGTFNATDADQDSLIASVETPPAKGDVAISTTSPLAFTYTPRANQNGADSFTYTVHDGSARSAAATIIVNITPIDDAPSIVQTFSLDEDAPTSAVFVTDADGDTFAVELLTNATNGTATLDSAAAGRVHYAPDQNYHGSDSIQLRATDSKNSVTTQTVQITVRSVNDAPLAAPASLRTVQGGVPVQFDALANATDVENDPLTVVITSQPTDGTASVDANGVILFTPTSSFVGGTSFVYEVRDQHGGGGSALISIFVRLTAGVLFRSGPTIAADDQDLYYADGTETFQVTLRAPDERLESFAVAPDAPVVFYQTTRNTVRWLFRIDLRQRFLGRTFGIPTAHPGVTEFAFSADGSKVAWVLDGRLNFMDIGATTEVHRDLGSAADIRNLFMNPSGTRLFFNGLITAPMLNSRALFSLSTAGGSLPQQITPTVGPADSTGPVNYLARDEGRLYYSVSDASGSRHMAVDPDIPGTEFTVLDGTTTSVSMRQFTQDETVFWGGRVAPREDFASVLVGNPGTPTLLTADTPNGTIWGAEMTADGSRFYYARADFNQQNSRLYSVDPAAPVSVPIAIPPVASLHGITSFSLAPGGENLVYATNDQVIAPGVPATGLGKVYYVDLSNPGISHPVKQFTGRVDVLAHAPDGSFAVIRAADASNATLHERLYSVNLRDRSQVIRLIEFPADEARLVLTLP